MDFLYYFVGTGRLNYQNRREIVVLLQVLPHDVNAGYHNIHDDVIRQVNGKEISSFREFVEILNKDKNENKFTVLETEHNLRIIIKNENIDSITQEILKQNNIPFQSSQDVADWLSQKGQPNL